jgi:hypothetical protein
MKMMSYMFLLIALLGACSLFLSLFADMGLTLLSLVMLVTGLFSWYKLKDMDDAA